MKFSFSHIKTNLWLRYWKVGFFCLTLQKSRFEEQTSLSIFQSGSFSEAKLELVRINLVSAGGKKWRWEVKGRLLLHFSSKMELVVISLLSAVGQTCWPTLFCKAAQRQDDETWTAGSFRHHPAPLTLVVCASKPSSQRPLLWVDWEEQFF